MKSYVIALLVVVGILAGFYGGFKVGQNNVSANTNASTNGFQRSGNGGTFTGGRGAGGFGGVCPSPGAPSPSPGTTAIARGTVSNLATGSMTVTSTACDVQVKFGPTVSVQKQDVGSTSDLQDNLIVTIQGTRQADGSILAQTILIGTAGTFTRGGGGTGSGAGSGG